MRQTGGRFHCCVAPTRDGRRETGTGSGRGARNGQNGAEGLAPARGHGPVRGFVSRQRGARSFGACQAEPQGHRGHVMDWQLLFYRSFVYLVHGIIVYVAAINLIYFLMMALGYFALSRYDARLTPGEREAILKTPLAPEIAVIAPAHNEALTVRESVRGMLKLNYPSHQVIVVNDGSKDDTLEILIKE